MSQLTERLALALFTVLSGALVTNMFVLQPPARRGVTGPEDRIAAMRQDGLPTGAINAPITAPAASSSSPPAEGAKPDVSALPSSTSASNSQQAVTPTEQRPLKIAPPAPSANPELVRALQRELRAKGYETGAEDGTLTLVTRAAIMAYEADQQLPLTAEPREELLTELILGEVGGAGHKGTSNELSPAAQDVVRAVQADLKRKGFDPGAEDGHLSEATIRAIRSFEEAEHMAAKGRISGELIAKLKTAPDKQASR